MRDILNRLDSILTEATLLAGQMQGMSNVSDPKTGKTFTRPELFLYKVKNSSPFTLDAGGEVIIDPKKPLVVNPLPLLVPMTLMM